MSKKVSIKGVIAPETVAVILEDLLKSFRKGQVVIQNDSDFVVLKPTEAISIELEAGSKKGKEKLVIELDWQQEVEVSPEAGGFRISSEAPEIPAEEDMEVVCCVTSEIPGVAVSAPTAAAPVRPAAMTAPAAKAEPQKDDKAKKEDFKAKK